jgi:hypothetical protein
MADNIDGYQCEKCKESSVFNHLFARPMTLVGDACTRLCDKCARAWADHVMQTKAWKRRLAIDAREHLLKGSCQEGLVDELVESRLVNNEELRAVAKDWLEL